MAVIALCVSGCAQNKPPSRSVELVIAFPPGGVTDIAARVFAEEMSRELKTPVVPINRAGASGVVGANSVLNARKDGSVWLASTISGMVLGPSILKDAGYEADKDFIPIALISTIPDGLVVRPDSPYQSVQELINAAKTHPGKLSYASAGTGTDGHFNAELLAQSANLKIKHVPFKGGAELAVAVMGGHVDFGMGSATTFFSLIKGMKLKALAITGNSRMKSVPDAPTFQELGIQGSFLDSWTGCFVAANTPQNVVHDLVTAASKIIATPSFANRIEQIGGVAKVISPAEFAAMIVKDKAVATQIATRLRLVAQPQ